MLVASALLVPAAPVAAAPAEKWRPHLRVASAYAAQRAGTVSFALRTPRHLYGYRSRLTTRSASVVKAMLMVNYLNHRSVRGRRLRAGDRALLSPMITRSDNAAATRIRTMVGNGALRHLARRVGMRDFATHPIWGLTQITAADQTKLFLRIDRYVVRRHRDTALRLLSSIVPRQRWGIARARPRGWALYFKGGWVRGIENQVGLLRRGGRRLAVAVFTAGSPSSAYGRATERGVARRLLAGLGRRSVPR